MHRNVMLTVLLLLFPIAAGAQTQDLILPVVLNGFTVAPMHYQTIIRILELFPIARSGTKTVFKIDAGGSVEAFTAEDVPALNGWVRLTFDSQATIQASAEVALIKRDDEVRLQTLCQHNN